MLEEGPPRWGLPEDLWPYTSWMHTAKKYVLKGCSGEGGKGGGFRDGGGTNLGSLQFLNPNKPINNFGG